MAYWWRPVSESSNTSTGSSSWPCSLMTRNSSKGKITKFGSLVSTSSTLPSKYFSGTPSSTYSLVTLYTSISLPQMSSSSGSSTFYNTYLLFLFLQFYDLYLPGFSPMVISFYFSVYVCQVSRIYRCVLEAESYQQRMLDLSGRLNIDIVIYYIVL